MKKLLWFLLAISLAAGARAQSNAPIRLALITENQEASAPGDLLTVELSKNPQIQLLDRTEIDRVYQEQALSSAKQNYLKLGQVLGADGLLLIRASQSSNAGPTMAVARFASNQKSKFDVDIQLIAVKPGVLVSSEKFDEVEDMASWADGLAAHLKPLLPKLSVLAQDAVPISVVNLRAAIKSPETENEERQLTALTIDRLSRERQLFVLERTKMQQLTSEKELNGLDNSAFWNGSYLLDGTIDRNGYSKDTMTLSAELTPPKGGAPIVIEVSGNRTNLSEAINELAEKICASLKVAQNTAPWNATDEAQKYYEEAKWALRWNLLDLAQSSAESAWALGKQDMECALVRVGSYARAIAEVDPPNLTHIDLNKRKTFICVTNVPDPLDLDRAQYLLRIYEQFGRTLPADEPKDCSPYYAVGMDTLEKASGVLRHFHYHPESQAPVADKLAELRAETRNVAAWISRSPSVRQTYWLGDHIAGSDEIYHDFRERYDNGLRAGMNFYEAELKWGCFWQETPEDCCKLYRSLMQSPLFVCIQNELWRRDDDSPRLAAWTQEDRKQVSTLWQGFIVDLQKSTNDFLGMEARVSQFVDAEIYCEHANADWTRLPPHGHPGYRTMESVYAEREQKMASAWSQLIDFVFSNYDQIVAGREELLYTGLKLDQLFAESGVVIPTREKLKEEFRTGDSPRLGALHDNYCNQNSGRLKELNNHDDFEKQRQYLASFTPYDFRTFYQVFRNTDYSKKQAAELKPLIDAYVSNIVAIAEGNPKLTNHWQKTMAQSPAESVRHGLGRRVDEILNANPPTKTTIVMRPASVLSKSPVAEPVAEQPDNATNALVLHKFFAFPQGQLPATNRQSIAIFGERVCADKLLLDLRYRDEWWEGNTNSSRKKTVFREAVAIWRPDRGWDVIPYRHSEDSIGFDYIQSGLPGQKLFAELFDNDLYVSDRDAIRKYNFETRQWQELPFSGQGRAQLFVINKHLYAASTEGIWEILDGGQSSKILASTRRRPASTILDSRDSLGEPVLFSGKDNSLWAALNGDVFSWAGPDWKFVLTVPGVFFPPRISNGAAFFWARPFPEFFDLWRFSPGEAAASLCLHEVRKVSFTYSNEPGKESAMKRRPLWDLSGNTEVTQSALATEGSSAVVVDGSSIYLVTFPADSRTRWTSETEAEDARRGLRPALVCLLPEIREPFTVPIRFDRTAGPMPVLNRMAPGSSLWIDSSSEYLFVGAPNLPGVWALPKVEIRAELDRQIKARPPIIPESESTQEEETSEHREKLLLANYDLNHNGKIDSQEREAAINDASFLDFDLDNIDTNHNGQLDPDELRYFDVNKNGHLDPPEASAIRAVFQILAERALKEFDANGNGRLDSQEFSEFTRNKASSAGFRAWQLAPHFSEAEHIQHYLEAGSREKLEQRLSQGVPGWNPRGYFGFGARDDLTVLTQEMDIYWSRARAGL